MHGEESFIKPLVRVSIILLLLVTSLLLVPSTGLKRHGEDIGGIPLAVPVEELGIIINDSIRIMASTNTSFKSDILEILEKIGRFNNTSRIAFYSDALYNYLNNTSMPWINRFDYIELSVLASIESSYNNIIIIDPTRLITLLRKYEEERVQWLINEIEKKNPLLAEYITAYNNANDTLEKKRIFNNIRAILAKLADKGEIDLIMLASEALNTSSPLNFMIDRIELVKYINDTARALKKYNGPGIARIIRLLETVSSDLYRGKISSAWQYLSLLKEEILRINITLDFEDAVKLSALLSITGITLNGAFINTGSLRSTAVIADILSSLSYNVKLKSIKILAEVSSGKNKGESNINIPLQSFKALTTILAVNSSETSLGMLALRQPPISGSTKYSMATSVMSNPIVFVAIVSISVFVAGVILYSTLRLPISKTISSRQDIYFNETPLRRDRSSRLIIEYYVKALGILSSRGYPRFYWETPREHLSKLEGTSCYEPFSAIVELYEKTVFGEEQVVVSKEFLEKLLERIEKCI